MTREYQEDAVNKMLAADKRLMICLPTGTGKSHVIASYVSRSNAKRILILVHRKELLDQIREKVEYFEPVYTVNSKTRPSELHRNFRVVIGMERSFFNRKKHFGDFDVVVIDEAHLGNFNKFIRYYRNYTIIGCTATPVAADGSALRAIYKKMDGTGNVSSFISDGWLSDIDVFAPDERLEEEQRVDKSERYTYSVLDAYKRLAQGKKTIVYNISVAQSKEIQALFENERIDCRHIDGKTALKERKETITWFKNTKGAILTNVGIATLGFDCPDVDCIIFNRETWSLPLYMQIMGRGARVTDEKHKFTVIDMGGNVFRHGDWRKDRPWEELFKGKLKKKSLKKARHAESTKKCPCCDKLMSAYKRTCPHCGYKWPVSYFHELKQDLISYTEVKYGISVPLLIFANRHRKPDVCFRAIGTKIAQGMRDPDEARKDYWRLARYWSEKTGNLLTEEHLNQINAL
ncbi:MAG: DEAD/DEAH box helicase family protein [Candidatus Saccharimonadales bacterium]